MFEYLPVLGRAAMYALRGSFLIRPRIVGAVLSTLEEEAQAISG